MFLGCHGGAAATTFAAVCQSCVTVSPAASATRGDPQSLQPLTRGGPDIAVDSTAARQLSVVTAAIMARGNPPLLRPLVRGGPVVAAVSTVAQPPSFVAAVQWCTAAQRLSVLQPIMWRAAIYHRCDR